MSSEQLADGVNPLDAELAATWDVLKGYSGRDTDLGIARRFGGAAAAYSLRDIGAMNGRVVRVRRDSDDAEEDFSANQIASGALENFVGSGNDGFVSIWYDQSGNGFDMTQGSATLQPFIIQNGVSYNGVFAPINTATSGDKIHLESLFRNQNFPANTSKVSYIVVGENITALGNGNDKGTIFGSFRGVANYTTGQLGLTIEPTNKLGLYNGLANANIVQKVDLTTSGDNAIETNKVIMVASANNRSVTLFSNTQTTTSDFVRNTGGNEDLNLDDSSSEQADKNYLQIFAPNRDGVPRARNYSFGTIRECILITGDSAVDDLTDLRNDLNNHYQYY